MEERGIYALVYSCALDGHVGTFLPGYKDGADSHLVSITESDVFVFSYLFLQMFESLKSN